MTRYLVCPRCGAVLSVDTEPEGRSKNPHMECPFCRSEVIVCPNWSTRYDIENAYVNLRSAENRLLRAIEDVKNPNSDEPTGGV